MKRSFWPKPIDYGDRPPPAIAWRPLPLALFAGVAGGGLLGLIFAAVFPVVEKAMYSGPPLGGFFTYRTERILAMAGLFGLLGVAAAAVEGLVWRSWRRWLTGAALALLAGLPGLIAALFFTDDDWLVLSPFMIFGILCFSAGRNRRSGEGLAAGILGGALAGVIAGMLTARLGDALEHDFRGLGYGDGGRLLARALGATLLGLTSLGCVFFLRRRREAPYRRWSLLGDWLGCLLIIAVGLWPILVVIRDSSHEDTVFGACLLTFGGGLFFFLHHLILASAKRRPAADAPNVAPAARPPPFPAVAASFARFAPTLTRLWPAVRDALACALLAGFGLLLAQAALGMRVRDVNTIFAAVVFIPAVSAVELLLGGTWKRWLLAVALGSAAAFVGALLSAATTSHDEEWGMIMAWAVGAGAGIGLAHGLSQRAWGASIAGTLLGQVAGLAGYGVYRLVVRDDRLAWLFFPAAAMAGVLYGGLGLVARLWGAQLGLAPADWPALVRRLWRRGTPRARDARLPEPAAALGLSFFFLLLIASVCLSLLLLAGALFPPTAWWGLTSRTTAYLRSAFLLAGTIVGAGGGLLSGGLRRAADLLARARLGRALAGGLLGLLGGWLAWRVLWLRWNLLLPYGSSTETNALRPAVLLVLAVGLLAFVIGLGWPLLDRVRGYFAPVAGAPRPEPPPAGEGI